VAVIFERIADQHRRNRKQAKKRKPVHNRPENVEVAAGNTSPL
jgi:hypothetical protein